MAPKKAINPKSVTKSITSFNFIPLTKSESEALRAQEVLKFIEEKIQREKADEVRNEASRRSEVMSSLINSTSALRIDIIKNIDEVIENLGNNVETTTFQVTKQKKSYKKRPPEWQEIAVHYQNYKNVDKTIKAYNLLETKLRRIT